MELDMLQIKIDRAKEELPKETIKAIDSVNWRAYILGLREKKGLSFEQLEDLELETELLLCGLLRPEDYPKELEERMKIPKPQVDLLVSEMNEFVFKKIKDELIKNTEKEEIFAKKVPTENFSNPIKVNIPQEKNSPVLSNNTNLEIAPTEISAPKNETISKNETSILQKAGIEIADNNNQPKIANYESKDKEIADQKTIKSISSQKLSGSFQIPTVKTQYSLENLSKQGKTETKLPPTPPSKKVDPYRIDPSE